MFYKMTKKFLLLAPMLLVSSLGTSNVLAAEYPEADKAKSDLSVSFEKTERPGEIPDPENPLIPWEPEEENPGNPNEGELQLRYISDFKFGTHEKSVETVYALADKDKNGKEVTPFLTTVDNRGSERKGWELTAKLGGDWMNGQHKLEGAELQLSNMNYKTTDNGTPTPTAGIITLNDSPQTITLANKIQGTGSYSMAFGSLDGTTAEGQTTSGVSLHVPKNVQKDEGSYTNTIEWELRMDPTALSTVE